MSDTCEHQDELIDVSVILPVYRAVGTLAACLDSLGAQTLTPERFEVLAIFNGPDDGGYALAEDWARAHPEVQLVLLESDMASAGAARNVGLEAARGRNITFVDADDWISPQYLAEMLAHADGFSIPIAGVVDVALDGSVEEDTAVMRSLRGRPRRFLLAGSQAISLMMAAKLYPRGALEGVRFHTELRSGEDLVFNAEVFGDFLRRFAVADQAPLEAGAVYHRRLTASSVSRQELTWDFAIEQRLAVIRALTAGSQANAAERTLLVRNAIAGQLSFIERFLSEHPEERGEVEKRLALLPGVSAASGDRWPDHGMVFGRRAEQPVNRVTLVSGATKEIVKRRHEIAMLRSAGIGVQTAFFTGPIDPKVMAGPRLRFTVAPDVERHMPRNSSVRADMARRAIKLERRSRKLVRRGAPYLLPARMLPHVLARTDGRAAEFMAGTQVIALDNSGDALARAFGVEPHASGALGGLVLSAASTMFPITRPQAIAVRKAAREAGRLETDSAFMPPARVWALAAWRLLRCVRVAAAAEVLEIALRVHADSADAVGLDMLRVLERVTAETVLADDWQAVSRRTLAEADKALANGELERAAFLTGLVCEVAFAPDLQTNVAHPPLFEDPEAFMAPLAGSRVWQEVVADSPKEGTVAVSSLPDRPRVLVVPGCYPKFADGIAEALQEHCQMEVLPLQELDASFGSIGSRPTEILTKLEARTGGGRSCIPDGVAEVFADRDVIFVDWVDRGAVLASLLKPAGSRLVLRFHGVDSLSMWQFLVDWSRVDDVVFVSEHLRRTVESLLGDRMSHCRVHVTGNVVDVDRFEEQKDAEASRTLGLVGWAQRVKDPLWALEVLSILRAQDPSWRLKLVGKDFPVRQPRVGEDEYARRFRERVLQPDVVDAVEYVNFSKDLPRHLRGIGFALSTSLRESWHIGVVEMVASGAVPVVRNWPVYDSVDGARGLYGDWVVETPQEAADRISALSREEERAAVAKMCRDEARRRFGGGDTGATYRRIILGHEG